MVTRAALLTLLVVVAAAVAAQQPPSLTQAGGIVSATLPVSILQTAAVNKHLASGLTTTFVVAARQQQRLLGARIEIRYDLWDEVWHVRRIEFDRKTDRQRLTSREALEKWWRTPVRVFSSSAPNVPIQVELTVLPFSASEEEDARQWIAKGGGVATPSGEGLVDVLIGTTLAAKPIIRWRWDVQVAGR